MGDTQLSTFNVQPSTYLIVGLGNPGREYRGSRHNVGFMVLDRLADRLGVTFSRVESRALVTKAEHLESKLILAKPQTFMNLSGQAVSSLLRFYKLPLERMMVVYDDVDLPLKISWHTRVNLDGQRIAVAGRAAFDHIRDIYIVARQPNFG